MTEEYVVQSTRYPSDLSDEEWKIIEPIFEILEPYKTGRRRNVDRREILNAIFYLNKTGCPWRYLPKDFPDQKLVNYYYNKWTDNGLLVRLNTELRQRFREKKGEIQTRRARSLIAKASKAPQNHGLTRDLMEANSSRAERAILLSIQSVACWSSGFMPPTCLTGKRPDK